jgi:hypothetical protein
MENDKSLNDTIKRVLIWRFTLVLIKIHYGQIGDQTGLFYRISCTWRSQYWYTSIVHNTGIKICSSIVIFFQNFVQYWYTSNVIKILDIL